MLDWLLGPRLEDRLGEPAREVVGGPVHVLGLVAVAAVPVEDLEVREPLDDIEPGHGGDIAVGRVEQGGAHVDAGEEPPVRALGLGLDDLLLHIAWRLGLQRNHEILHLRDTGG